MIEAEDNLDAVLARELNSVSLQERNTVLEGIHGVDDVIKETPEMIQSKLAEFQQALDRFEHHNVNNNEDGITSNPSISVSKGALRAYLQARQQNEDYVKDWKFRLMFLRAEAFEATLAAQRMLIYLEEKLIRFGPRKLTKSLTLKDLSPQSREMLTDLGIQQLLPARDSAGRAIVLVHQDKSPMKLLKEDNLSAVNLNFYLLSAAAEDEETQKRGLVVLMTIAHLPSLDEMEVIRTNMARGDVSKWCPLRIKANHIWAKRFQNNPLLRIILSTLSKGNRMRMRMHTGSYTELRYHLMTYGFPSDCLPYSSDGEELLLNAQNKWLSRRKKKENAMKNSAVFRALDLPGCRDVCLGRGSASHQHVGNVYMRTLMSTLLEEYRVGSSSQRQGLNRRLVRMVREGGGRFLTKTSGGWFEEVIDEAGIERRVGGSFRGMLSRVTLECETNKMQVDRSEMPAKRPRLDSTLEDDDKMSINCFGISNKERISPRFERSM